MQRDLVIKKNQILALKFASMQPNILTGYLQDYEIVYFDFLLTGIQREKYQYGRKSPEQLYTAALAGYCFYLQKNR